MTIIKEEEVKKLIDGNPHLKEYVDEIEKKMGKPTFFSKVPLDMREIKLPNLIYVQETQVLVLECLFLYIFLKPKIWKDLNIMQ